MTVNLLIIETDTVFRQNLAQLLTEERWRILFAENRVDAIKIVQRKNIDVALLGLKGFKKEVLMLLEDIKSAGSLTEVITINTSDQIILSIESMKMGAFDDFIVPFDIESLVQRIWEAHQKKKDNEKNLVKCKEDK